MKTKFILHGGFTSARNELNRTFYQECTKLPDIVQSVVKMPQVH